MKSRLSRLLEVRPDERRPVGLMFAFRFAAGFTFVVSDNMAITLFLSRFKGSIFGFEGVAFDRIRAIHLGPDPEDPYAILGLPHDAEDAELKRQYRTLIRDHHPDRAMAQGLPEEFVELANEKMAAINAAYERIAKQRGLA